MQQAVEYQGYIIFHQLLESVSDAANLPSEDIDRGAEGYWIKRLISPRMDHKSAMAQVLKDIQLRSESDSGIFLPEESVEKQGSILSLSGSNVPLQDSEAGRKHYYLSKIFSCLKGRNSV